MFYQRNKKEGREAGRRLTAPRHRYGLLALRLPTIVAPLFAILVEIPPVFPKVLFVFTDVLIVFPEFLAVLGQLGLAGAFPAVFSQLTAVLPALAPIFPQVLFVLPDALPVLADVLCVLTHVSLGCGRSRASRGRSPARGGRCLLGLADTAAA